MAAVLRTILLFHEGISGYPLYTTLNIILKIVYFKIEERSAYDNSHSRDINWVSHVADYCTSAKPKCRPCHTPTISIAKFKHELSDKRNYFKTMSHYVCCVWNGLDQVWGSECAAGGYVV